ncbi:MAG: hypothetical protein OQJ89_09875 [Kangiellaceae bacterium]|nr:hypothetical protein [Kangiellaceae bacterium]MCW8998812.1 hypothetical protein [Kangiellaceae bacterium]MCW9017263.1 hypothetical protein [Kangiellaceae bacterium]
MASLKLINNRFLILTFAFIGIAKADPMPNTATLLIKAPEIQANKKIFNLDAYKTLECPLKKKLNSSHPDYLGRLHYQVAKGDEVIQREVSVSIDSPIMLSATFATVDGDNQSEICYYQSHSFWPQAGKTYKVNFLENCTVKAERIDKSGKATEVKLNNLVDTCFNQTKN